LKIQTLNKLLLHSIETTRERSERTSNDKQSVRLT